MKKLECNVKLVEQTSLAACVAGVSYGCHSDSSFWVANCRGRFRCGAGQSVNCGYPPGLPRYVCHCEEVPYVPRNASSHCERAQRPSHLAWRDTTPVELRQLERTFTANVSQYQALHPEMHTDIAAERALMCGRTWNAHEQQRSSAACTIARSFASRVGGKSPQTVWCAALVRRIHSVAFVGDSMLRQQFHQLICSCRDLVDVERTPPARRYWRCRSRGCLNGPARVELYEPESGARCVLQYFFAAAHHAPSMAHSLDYGIDPSVWTSDALVIGIGAWVSSGMPSLSRWRDILTTIATRLGRHRFRGAVVWMEYYAGHFATPTGEWGKAAKNGTACAPVTPMAATSSIGLTAGNEWAGSAAIRAPIWRVAALSQPRHLDHPGSLAIDRDFVLDQMAFAVMMDCRHWCFPGATLEARNRVLVGLLKECST